MSNRLATESSPYLLQHRDNPVDWYPWGQEALHRARTEDLPILLSIGYSACHWCHVMEAESFADPEVAALMNAHFVNIKVDREERPDIDSLYMQAVQQMTGRGGWPMTVFLTPTGSPFYGGTYFPPEPRHGLPSFRQVLLGVREAYRTRREEVERSADELLEGLRQGLSVNPAPGAPDETLLDRAYQQLARRFDPEHAGFGGAPKFPQPMVLDFLLLHWARTGEEGALAMVEATLEAMARGGIHDQIGGGFHRYAVDAKWLVPHFEKMLYDNALLAQSYLRAFQATGRTEFRAVAEGILDYVAQEMTSPEGGFFSSQDADSEGEEGKFYLWGAEEIDAVLGAEEGALFRQAFDITPLGNWEGRNIPNLPHSLDAIAERVGVSRPEVDERLERGRQELYRARSARIWPGCDDKVLTSWNAMMISAYALAGQILGSAEYLERARAGAEFILSRLRVDGRVMRSWREGSSRIEGFLKDHALFVDALLQLYEGTFEIRWVEEARLIADQMIERFWSEEEELFYDAPGGAGELLLRPRDLYDNAVPSGTSAAALALLRLARLVGEPRYERIAARVVLSMGEIASEIPQAFGNLLVALSRFLAPPSEVAIVGDPADPATAELLKRIHARFLPFTTLALRRPDAAESIESAIPLLAGRTMVSGEATAYLCRNYSCRAPVTTPDALDEELNEVAPGR